MKAQEAKQIILETVKEGSKTSDRDQERKTISQTIMRSVTIIGHEETSKDKMLISVRLMAAGRTGTPSYEGQPPGRMHT